MKVNTDGVVFLVDLITNGIEKVTDNNGNFWKISDFDKLARKEIPEFVDANISIFENIVDKYRNNKELILTSNFTTGELI